MFDNHIIKFRSPSFRKIRTNYGNSQSQCFKNILNNNFIRGFLTIESIIESLNKKILEKLQVYKNDVIEP
jgi:hypothetical protein